MRGRAGAAVLWCVATLGATLLVQSGVGTIRTATRSDAVVDVQAVNVDPATTTGGSPSAGAVPSSSAAASGAPSASTTAPGAAPTTITSGAPSAPTTVVPPPSTPVTTPAPPTAAPSTVAAVTRTITARGGTATVRFRPDDVTVVAATPNAGYAVDINRGTGRVRIEFESDDHRSRIEAWWDGEPRDEVREN